MSRRREIEWLLLAGYPCSQLRILEYCMQVRRWRQTASHRPIQASQPVEDTTTECARIPMMAKAIKHSSIESENVHSRLHIHTTINAVKLRRQICGFLNLQLHA